MSSELKRANKTIKFIFFTLPILLFLHPVYAETSQFVFITEPQSVAPGATSLVITVQSQDDSGNKLAVGNAPGDTADVVFTSTSATGQFLNSSGDPVTKTISYNSYTKNFYYLDPTPGVHTITVTATTRTSKKIFSASQKIFVGQSASGDNSNNDNDFTVADTNITITTQTTTPTSSSNQTTSSTKSAHSSPAPLSETEEKIDFEISAGRDRLTAVGNSLVFRAVPTKFENIPASGITYYWSFNDGTTAVGNNISHTYKFAGEYFVVVNANYSDKQAVSRLVVQVISPNVSIAKVSGGLEISNISKTEINLEGWKLVSTRKTFIFPGDTLIPSGKKITFADDVTGMLDETIQLVNPLGKEFASITKVDVAEAKPVVVNVEDINLDDIQVKIDEVKSAVAQISRPAAEIELPSGSGLRGFVSLSSRPVTERPIPDVASALQASPDEGANGTDQRSAEDNFGTGTVTVFEAPKTKGFVSTIFSWPIKGFNLIKRLFVEE